MEFDYTKGARNEIIDNDVYVFGDCVLFSAGVGRTGLFIALSIVLERMRYETIVDLFQTVRMLRSQRPSMVQTEVWISFRVNCRRVVFRQLKNRLLRYYF